ncbi:MAG: hypothetical protein KF809_18060 [Chloroflexi bacterium]|nr:hypothetical protein [Chloroflexota bacterium]
MRTTRAVVTAVLFTLVPVVLPVWTVAPALACSSSAMPLHDRVVGARAIVRGVVERGPRIEERRGARRVHVRVTEVLKGAAPTRIDVTDVRPGICESGPVAPVGWQVLLFLDVPTPWGATYSPATAGRERDRRSMRVLTRDTDRVRRLLGGPGSFSIASISGATLWVPPTEPSADRIEGEESIVHADGLAQLIVHPEGRVSVQVGAPEVDDGSTLVIRAGPQPTDAELLRIPRLRRDIDSRRTIGLDRAAALAGGASETMAAIVAGPALVASLAAGGQLIEVLAPDGHLLMRGILVPRPLPPLDYGPVIPSGSGQASGVRPATSQPPSTGIETPLTKPLASDAR